MFHIQHIINQFDTLKSSGTASGSVSTHTSTPTQKTNTSVVLLLVVVKYSASVEH